MLCDLTVIAFWSEANCCFLYVVVFQVKMGNRQTKAAKPQTEVTQTARKFEPEPEPSTVKTEVPVAIPETPPQPSEPPFEPPPDDTSPTKDTTDPQEPPLEDPSLEHTEIKETKESEKELLEPLPVLLNESELVEEKLKKSEEVVHVVESVTEQNELVSVTAPVTDQEIIFEDPIPIISNTTTTETIKEITSEDNTKNEINEINKNEIDEINKNEIESKIEVVSSEAVLLDSEIAVCKEEMKEEVKNEEEEEEDEEIADSKTPSIAMETASVSSSAIKMDVEYMKGIMGTSLAFPDATSNESVIGSLAVSEQTLDESLWDNSGGSSKISMKGPIPTKEDSLISMDFQVIDQTVGVVLNTVEPVQKEDQKKQEMIPEEHEISEVKEVQTKPVLDPLDEELPAPESSHSTSNLEKFESFVSIEFREENEEIKVGLNCVSKAQIASSTSIVSDKQMSVELKTPFVNVDEEDANLKESKSADAFSDSKSIEKSKSSEKSKTKKPKKSTSMKSTGSGTDGDLQSTNPQVKRSTSGQSKLLESSS